MVTADDSAEGNVLRRDLCWPVAPQGGAHGWTAVGDTMEAVVKAAQLEGGTEFRKVPIPKVGPNDVLIANKVVSVCGTDVHIWNWDAWAKRRIKVPLVYGHEFCGEVVKVGNAVDWLTEGEYVSAESHIACNTCFQCRTGNGHICERMKILGVDRDGIFTQFTAVPATNVWRNAPGLPREYASVQDPLGNAVHTVFSGDPVGRDVAIFGMGPIGLMAVRICKLVGASRVIAVGHRNQYRLDLARTCGADVVIKSAEEDVVARIKEETGGTGVHEVYEMSGAGDAMRQALEVGRPGAGIHLLGIFTGDVTIDLNALMFRYLRIQGINGRLMWDTWFRMAGLFKAGLDLGPILTHQFSLSEFPKAMELMRSGQSGKITLKVD